MGKAKRNVRDSVFINIFRDKKYLVELYRSLHPEDDVDEDDLEINQYRKHITLTIQQI